MRINKSMLRSVCCAMALLVLSTGFLQADDTGINLLPPAVAAKVDSEIINGGYNYRFINIALVYDGKIALTKTYGENKVDKVLCWASITKPVTAMVIMNLVEQGKIKSLDDNIGNYCEKYADAMPDEYAADSITFRQIMTHTSGIPHYQNQPTFIEGKYNLLSKPGTQFKYSTHAWGVMGDVLTAITGKDYNTLMTEYIAKPAGAATFRADTQEEEWKAPGGYIYSTIEDMAKVTLGVMNHQYVSEKTLFDEMVGPFPKPAKKFRGLSWGLWNRGSEDISFWHNGTTHRQLYEDKQLGTYMVVAPKKKFSVSLIGAREKGTSFDRLGTNLRLILEGNPIPPQKG